MTPVLEKLVPESFGLMREYHTTTVVAEAIAELLCPRLPELAVNDNIVRALEPSAGIRPLIRAFGPRRCLALEAGGQNGLIVANPPYQIEGKRTLP